MLLEMCMKKIIHQFWLICSGLILCLFGCWQLVEFLLSYPEEIYWHKWDSWKILSSLCRIYNRLFPLSTALHQTGCIFPPSALWHYEEKVHNFIHQCKQRVGSLPYRKHYILRKVAMNILNTIQSYHWKKRLNHK